MSAYVGIYDTLAQDTDLAGMLATDHEGNPAIYSTWGLRNRERPYIVLRIRFWPTTTPAVRVVDLSVDIFTGGESNELAEAIRDRVTALLNMKTIAADEAGSAGIRVRLEDDGEVPEPTENVVHWNVTFSGRFGPQRIIENLVT